MSRLNISKVHPHGFTAERAPAAPMTAEQALRRSVCSCFLFEDEFYESGEEIAERIVRLAKELPLEKVASIAIEAREQGNLRHVPLLLLSALAASGRGNAIVGKTVARVIQRPDELAEFLAVHAKVNGVTPDKVKKKISAQMKKGLASAFLKFNEYGLAKYVRNNSNSAIKMRDVLFLCHAKPKDEAQEALFKRLIAGTMSVSDTWETSLSTGADKKETWERLIREKKLGYMALLRNLRGMLQVNCDLDLIKSAILARKGGAERVLPFRYVAAAKAAPQLEPALDKALCTAINELPALPGKTVVMVDVSGSMDQAKVSAKSELTRRAAAAVLASMINGSLRLFAFADEVTELPPRHGMAGVDAIMNVPTGGTRLFDAIREVNAKTQYDRLIVITDEQAFPASPRGMYEVSTGGGCPAPKGRGYMINVASNQKGVGYGQWVHIDGFSESVLKFIHEYEKDVGAV